MLSIVAVSPMTREVRAFVVVARGRALVA